LRDRLSSVPAASVAGPSVYAASVAGLSVPAASVAGPSVLAASVAGPSVLATSVAEPSVLATSIAGRLTPKSQWTSYCTRPNRLPLDLDGLGKLQAR